MVAATSLLLLSVAILPAAPASPALASSRSASSAVGPEGRDSGPTGDVFARPNGALSGEGQWTRIPAYNPGSALLATDPSSGDVLSFGGLGPFLGYRPSGPFNLTWTFSGGMWQNLTGGQAPPVNLTLGAVASDPPDHGVLLTGSTAAYAPPWGAMETWLYSGGNWSQLHPAASPTSRFWSSMAWDASTGSIILFGGTGPNGDLNDTWSYSNGTWTNLSLAIGPPVRSHALIEFDAADGYLLLFGGQGTRCSFGCTEVELNDTWAFHGGRWSQLLSGSAPPANAVSSMASNPGGGPILLYTASFSYPGARAETWSFTGGAWRFLRTDWAPSAPFVALDWDPEIHAIVQSTGTPYVYQWNGTGWNYAGGVLGRGAAATYDAKDGYVVAYANVNSSSLLDTYRFDGRNWWRVPVAVAPPHRLYPLFAYDPAAGGAILFGGANATNSTACYGDAWLYSGARWTILPGSIAPPPRCQGAIAYDASLEAVVVSGGFQTPYTRLNDTWEYHDGGWSLMHTAHAPPALPAGSLETLTPDPLHQWLVAFDSGEFGLATQKAGSQTWEFDGQDWTQLSSPITPEPRTGEAAGFDPAHGYALLVGGVCDTCPGAVGVGIANDTWGFAGGSWFRVPTKGGLPAVTDGSLVYDSAIAEMVLAGGAVYSDVGGSYQGAELADTWLLAPPPLTTHPEPVLFRESGLPPDSVWAVSVGNATDSANSTVVSFGVPNGSYPYSIPYVGDYRASPASGSVVVAGGVTTVGVVFHRDYTVPLLVAGSLGSIVAASVVAVWYGRKRPKEPRDLPGWNPARYDVGTSFAPREPFPRPPPGSDAPPGNYGPP
ncbi:MAG TPA: hypothetical protein VFF67_07970 [Thermoplasmata archaeon]|nr:hypothetical protein [Thermoplasmata archaeon]